MDRVAQPVRRTAPRPAPRTVARIPVIIAIVFVAGMYTNLPLLIGASAFPMISALPGFVLLLPFLLRRYFTMTYTSAVGFAALAVALSMLAPNRGEMLVVRLVGGGQMLFALTLGLTAYWMVLSFPREKIARFLLLLTIVILVAGALEVLTPLKALTLAYTRLYGGEGVTDAVLNRDMGIGGGIRPKLFTSETSYVAMAASYAICCYVWTETRITKYFIGFGLILAAFVVLRSPTVLGSLLPCAVDFVTTFVRQRRTRDYTALLIPFAVVIILVITASVGDYVSGLIDARLEGARTGTDYSVTYRTYGAVGSGIAVANQHPLAGVGLGSYDLAKETIIHTELGYGVPISAISQEWRMSLNNAPGNSLVVFGYVGSIIIWTLAFIAIGRLAGGFTPMLAVMIAILSMSDGAIYSPRYVTYLLMFVALNRVILGRKTAAHARGYSASQARPVRHPLPQRRARPARSPDGLRSA